jgi:hypothetical protein
MKNKNYFNLLVLVFGLTISVYSQAEVYSTTNGKVKISTVVNGKVITATSNNLIVSLDYRTAMFEIKLDLSSLKTNIDSLNTLFSKYRSVLIESKGKMGINYIDTKAHPKQNFKAGLTLNKPLKTSEILGSGSLTHIGGIYSCILNLNFQINLNSLAIELPFKGANKINVQILQTILKRESD